MHSSIDQSRNKRRSLQPGECTRRLVAPGRASRQEDACRALLHHCCAVCSRSDGSGRMGGVQDLNHFMRGCLGCNHENRRSTPQVEHSNFAVIPCAREKMYPFPSMAGAEAFKIRQRLVWTTFKPESNVSGAWPFHIKNVRPIFRKGPSLPRQA